MSQNDLVIANQSAPDFRSDLNDALQALASLNSGSTAPSTTYANMLWYDTGNNTLKMRSEADDAWIDIGTLNQSTNEFEAANLTELTETQAEDDTSTVFGLVSGERLKQAFDQAFGEEEQQIGVGQTPQDMTASRSFGGTVYQNTTGKPIWVAAHSGSRNSNILEVSSDNSTWLSAGSGDGGARITRYTLVPHSWYYRYGAISSNDAFWVEIR